MEVKPTRSELIKLKKRIKLAKSGYNLLKKKRDGLILEFFEILKKAKTIRMELAEAYRTAQQKVNVARVLEGDLKVTSLSLAIPTHPDVNLSNKNIMGVIVPSITSQVTIGKKEFQRGWGSYNSASVDEAAGSYEKVVEKIILAAESETAMKKLLIEIEKTKRRVNALEFNVIPKMNKIQSNIRLRLEEMERENVFRLKRIKG